MYIIIFELKKIVQKNMLNKIEDFQNLLNKRLNKFFDTKYIYLKKMM